MKTYKNNEIAYKRILGRNVEGMGEKEGPLALFWGAAALEVNVRSGEVWIQVSSDYDVYEPWIRVEVNGAVVSRFMVCKGEPHWVCIARGLNKDKENLVSIIKDTQPMSDDPKHLLLIHQVGLDDDGTFCKPVPRELNLEFIGDSITSGEGLAGMPNEQDWIPQWFCAGKTYAVQLAKRLNADFSVMSQCGWGICWGWNGDRNSALPPHYENVCSVLKGEKPGSFGANEKYSFKTEQDFIIINLGTNDNGAFFQPPWKDASGKEYVLKTDAYEKACEEDGSYIAATVKSFLKTIRLHNKKAVIIWCYGMITMEAIPDFISRGINEYKSEACDEKVHLLKLDSMDYVEESLEDKGSRGHPGPRTHRLAAEKLYRFIKDLQ